MKRMFPLLMVIILCLSVCACGVEKENITDITDDSAETSTTVNTVETSSSPTEIHPSKEDLIADAIKTDVMTLQSAALSNRLKAKQDYCNKPIIVTGKALRIKDDYVRICDGQVSVNAYLSVDELIKLKEGENITVVGIISDIQVIEETIAGTVWEWDTYIMDIAYLVEE